MNTLLKESVDAFLQRPVDYGAIFQKANGLHDLFAPLSGIEAGNINDEDIMTSQGKAISPIKAAFCLKEGYRTAMFVSGIYQAIRSLQERFPGERIRILYAGCGPYATLLTPLTAVFSPSEVSFVLLDINPTSIEAVKKLYAALNLAAYVEEYTCNDAITYKIKQPTHLVISETMLNALFTEPQVAIMLNLVPQLMEKALFIPQEIHVSAQLLDMSKEMKHWEDPAADPGRINLGKVYSISQEECLPHEEVILQIPQEAGKNRNFVFLTDITVFGDAKLKINDCSLNLPRKIMDISGHEGKKISFLYEMCETPKFNHRFVEEPVLQN